MDQESQRQFDELVTGDEIEIVDHFGASVRGEFTGVWRHGKIWLSKRLPGGNRTSLSVNIANIQRMRILTRSGR